MSKSLWTKKVQMIFLVFFKKRSVRTFLVIMGAVKLDDREDTGTNHESINLILKSTNCCGNEYSSSKSQSCQTN